MSPRRSRRRATTRSTLPILLVLASGAAVLSQDADPPAESADAGDTVVQVFDGEVIHWDEDRPDLTETEGYVIRHVGHTVERTIDLPAKPAFHRDDRRIVAVVNVEPISSTADGRKRPNDPWTRLGNVTILDRTSGGDAPDEIELVRFVTGYGGAGEFEQDVTALAPLLHGRAHLRVYLSSYSEAPGWKISLELRYTSGDIGQRRPAFARQLFYELHVTAADPTLSADVTIPPGLDPPRVRIISTGHATDGLAANEFLTCTHTLRIDGRVVAKWRPWSERGGPLRERNPRSGRRTVEGREIRASDLDRSGWNPGLVVEPLIIPVPELTPGPHRIEVRIYGIRREGPETETGKRHHGYWVVSATVVADEPWPKVEEEE